MDGQGSLGLPQRSIFSFSTLSNVSRSWTCPSVESFKSKAGRWVLWWLKWQQVKKQSHVECEAPNATHNSFVDISFAFLLPPSLSFLPVKSVKYLNSFFSTFYSPMLQHRSGARGLLGAIQRLNPQVYGDGLCFVLRRCGAGHLYLSSRLLVHVSLSQTLPAATTFFYNETEVKSWPNTFKTLAICLKIDWLTQK